MSAELIPEIPEADIDAYVAALVDDAPPLPVIVVALLSAAREGGDRHAA